MTKTYYAYFDTQTRLFFYYNAADGTSYWLYPEDGYVYEATTLRPVYPPGSPLRWEEGDDYEAELRAGIEIDPATGLPMELKPKKAAALRSSRETELELVVLSPPRPPRASFLGPEPDQHFEEEQASAEPLQPADGEPEAADARQQPKGVGGRKGRKAARRQSSGGQFPSVQQLLVGTINEFSKGKSFSEYAVATFRTRRGTDAAGPLLPSIIDKNLVKLSKDLGRSLVKFVTGPDMDAKQGGYFWSLYASLAGERRLIDEMYCQVMRCATNQDRAVVFMRSCQVLLVLATFFSPTDSELRESISSFLAQTTRNQAAPPAAASAACLALFRFEATCAVGQTDHTFIWHLKPGTKEVDPKEIEGIVTHPLFQRHFSFGTSLWEVFLGQSAQYPELHVPLIVDTLGKLLWDLGAERTEGIFRQPGNSKNIEAIIAAAESEAEFAADPAWSIHDIGSAFKQWFRSVPGAIVQKHEMGKLMQTANDNPDGKGFVLFASKLTPISNRFALMYLVGFLRRLAGASATTKMTPENLGMVFAPNITWTDPDADAMSIPKISAAASAFLCSLVGHWNVSFVYNDQ
jgi:hypothetical protein